MPNTKKPKQPKKLGPFDFLNSINDTKIDLMVDEESEKAYVPFIVNRGLSYFPDTALLANEMNVRCNISGKMQYAFLREVIRKKKRYSKWHKAIDNDDIELIKKHYGYSTRKAIDVLPLLTKEDLDAIRAYHDEGGRK